MKLTTARLKKLIREEMENIEEATPSTKNKGEIEYQGHRVRYYVYPVNVAKRDNVVGFQGKGIIGHYRVQKGSNLYQAIAADYANSSPNDVYTIGLENREIASILIKNNEIKKDRS